MRLMSSSLGRRSLALGLGDRLPGGKVTGPLPVDSRKGIR